MDAKLFHLGHNNPVGAVSTLTGNLAGAGLKVNNDGTGPALSLVAGAGKAPLTADAAAGTATGLSADELDGRDSSAYQARVVGSCAEDSSIRTIDAAGRAACEPDDGAAPAANALTKTNGKANNASITTDPNSKPSRGAGWSATS